MTIRVGITGGMGSGKTTVCTLFATLDIPTYNADDQAKALMISNVNLKKDIITLLGENAYSHGQLNTKYIAKEVFAEPTLLESLNRLVHPVVYKDLSHWFEKCQTSYALYESALISPGNHQRQLDYLIYVYASQNQRVERILNRNGINRAAILDRMATQPDPYQVIKYADYVIINEDRALIPQVLQIHRDLSAKT